MKLIVCIDDNGGLSFNGRRQSRDAGLTKWLLEKTRGFCYLPFSAALFQWEKQALLWENDRLPTDAWLFIEEPSKIPPVDEIHELLLCRWNRSYPADAYLPFDLNSFRCVEKNEFAGSSHERITVEHYQK